MAGVFVTGASGFVARNIRKALAEAGHRVVSASRSGFDAFGDERTLAVARYGDVSPRELAGLDAAMHLAGSGGQTAENRYRGANLDATREVVELCRSAGMRRIIYLSGLGASPRSTTDYFISKYAAERTVAGSGMEYVVFRPSYIVGRDDHLTRTLRGQAREGAVIVPGSGGYVIQPISIHDVSHILVDAVDSRAMRNRTLDMVGPSIISFLDYVRMFVGTKSPITHMKLEEAYRRAILGLDPPYGVDDLNIMVAGFTGDHRELSRRTTITFRTIPQMLDACDVS